MSLCIYCNGEKANCRHTTPETSALATRPAPPASSHLSPFLFEASDGGAMRCTLCPYIVPGPPYQVWGVLVHGAQHVRQGEARKVTSGPGYGATFLINEKDSRET